MRFRSRAHGDNLDVQLARLKQRGCNLLVTGTVADQVSATATRRLLGSPIENRTRVLVLTDTATGDIGTRLPTGIEVSNPDVRLVDWCQHGRAAAADSSREGDHGDRSIEALRATLFDELGALDLANLAPAELRLSLDSVTSLLEQYETADVHRLLRLVTTFVRGAGGMGHVHVPIPDGDDRIEPIAPLFDARIELRQRGATGGEQRWHLPRYGSTEWVRI